MSLELARLRLGISFTGNVIVAPFVTPTLAVGATGLCSTAPDMLKWQRGLVEHRVLRPDSYARMRTPVQLNDGRRADYGYGLVIWSLEGRRITFHTGGVAGYTAYLLPGTDQVAQLAQPPPQPVFAGGEGNGSGHGGGDGGGGGGGD